MFKKATLTHRSTTVNRTVGHFILHQCAEAQSKGHSVPDIKLSKFIN